jgi:2-C-methyl-D-erythritol 4-phosphate cytidylyltransferase
MVFAIIVAAGQGVRMQGPVRKQYLMLGVRPILAHTLLVFDACDRIDEIVVVIPKDDADSCRETLIDPLGLGKKIHLVFGGAERQDSVYNGLQALPKKAHTVVIHDGVRPFVRPEEIAACIDGAQEFGACILGLPVSDTLKRVDQSNRIKKTLDRDKLWLAQTPQVFRYDLICNAHKIARTNGYSATDDALLVERLGVDFKMITGSKNNIKITTHQDLVLARAILMDS